MNSALQDRAAFLTQRQFFAKGALGASALVLKSARRISDHERGTDYYSGNQTDGTLPLYPNLNLNRCEGRDYD